MPLTRLQHTTFALLSLLLAAFVTPWIAKAQSEGNLNWTNIEAVASKTTGQNLKSLDTFANYVKVQQFDDLSKAALIYTILALEVRYDIDAFRQSGSLGNVRLAEAKTVWSRRLGVCSGYVAVYRYVASKVGLQTYEVNGFARSADGEQLSWQQPNHAWVALLIGKQWHLIEPTWGAGGLQDDRYIHRFERSWFDLQPQAAILTHFPSAPMFQLLPCEVDLATIKKGSDQAISAKAGQKMRCQSFQDSLAAFVQTPDERKPLFLAQQAQRYNPENTLDLGLAYLNLSAVLMSRLLSIPDGEQAQRQYAKDIDQVAQMARMAKFHLGKSKSDAAAQIIKVADQNLEVASKNSVSIQKLLRRYK